MKRILPLLLALLLFALAGCGQTADPESSAAPEAEATATPVPTATPEPLPVIGLSLASDDAFTQAFSKEAQALATAQGYHLEVRQAAGDATQQLSHITELQAAEAKSLIVQPVDVDGLQYILDECELQGIRVINILDPINATVSCLISPDYGLVGEKGAKLVAEAAKDNDLEACKTLLLENAVDSFTMQLMHDGFTAAAKELEKVKIQNAFHFSTPEAAALDVLTGQDLSDTNAAFVQNSILAKAFAAKAPEHQTVTVGADKELLQMVKDKKIYATVFFGAKKLADLSIGQAVRCAGDPAYEPPEYIELPLGVASESSVDKYLAQEGTWAEPEE